MSKPKPRLYVLIMVCQHNTNWSSNTLVSKVFEPNTSIRLLIIIAAFFDLKIDQMDVKTAFLNRDLKEEIYMDQPEGFVEPG